MRDKALRLEDRVEIGLKPGDPLTRDHRENLFTDALERLRLNREPVALQMGNANLDRGEFIRRDRDKVADGPARHAPAFAPCLVVKRVDLWKP